MLDWWYGLIISVTLQVKDRSLGKCIWLNRDLIQKLGWELVGQCGVNSGKVMLVDPSYILNDKDYESLRKHRSKQGNMKPVIFKKGIISHTWMGDGNYHVYIQKDKDGRTERMLIDFTTTYGFDDENPNMHDIDMKELLEKFWNRQSTQQNMESVSKWRVFMH